MIFPPGRFFYCQRLDNKKTGLKKPVLQKISIILRQPGDLQTSIQRPVAFRPILTDGLAFSGFIINLNYQ
jgi:hypothetical protein